MRLPKLGGFWLFPPWDFPHLNESHPMDHDSDSSGHTVMQDATPLPENTDSRFRRADAEPLKAYRSIQTSPRLPPGRHVDRRATHSRASGSEMIIGA